MGGVTEDEPEGKEESGLLRLSSPFAVAGQQGILTLFPFTLRRVIRRKYLLNHGLFMR